MTVYVLIPFFLISTDPVIVTALIAVFNLLGIALLWVIAYRYFHPSIAVIACLAYAVNPWAIGYSKSIWAQNYHTPIFLAGLLLGLLGFLEGKRWAQLLCLPILVIAMQIHLAAWALLPVYVWFIWMGRKQISWKVLFASFGLTVITLIPYGIGTIDYLSRATASAVQPLGRELTFRNLIKPYGQNLWLITGLGIEQYAVRDRAEEFINYVGIPIVFWVTLAGFAILGIATLWNRWPRTYSILIYLWAFSPLAVLSFPIIDVAAHYFVPCIPAFMLLIAIGIVRSASWINQRMIKADVFIWGITGLVFVTQGIFTIRLTEYSRITYIPGQFGTATPFTYLKQIRDALLNDEDILILVSDNWEDWRANGRAVWSSLLRDTAICVRELKLSQQAFVLPNEPFVALFPPKAADSAIFQHLYQNDVEPTVISLRPGEGEYRIYRMTETPEWAGIEFQQLNPTRFENGLQLDGYTINSGVLWLKWSLPQADKIDYRTMITYLDGDGNQLDQQAVDFWPSANWCSGDRLIQYVELPSFPDETRLVRIRIQVVGSNIMLSAEQNDGTLSERVAIMVLEP